MKIVTVIYLLLQASNCLSQNKVACEGLPKAINSVLMTDTLFKDYILGEHDYPHIVIDTTIAMNEKLNFKGDIINYFVNHKKFDKIEIRPKGKEEIFMLNIEKWLEFNYIICGEHIVAIYLTGFKLENSQCYSSRLGLMVEISKDEIMKVIRSDWKKCQ